MRRNWRIEAHSTRDRCLWRWRPLLLDVIITFPPSCIPSPPRLCVCKVRMPLGSTFNLFQCANATLTSWVRNYIIWIHPTCQHHKITSGRSPALLHFSSSSSGDTTLPPPLASRRPLSSLCAAASVCHFAPSLLQATSNVASTLFFVL